MKAVLVCVGEARYTAAMVRRAWLVSLSTAFLGGVALVGAGILSGPGCTGRCESIFDCGNEGYCNPILGRCETECFNDEDCRNPVECRGNIAACEPGKRKFFCNSFNRCVAPFAFERDESFRESPVEPTLTSIDGWEDEPGLGKAFIVNNIAIAGKDRGFDIDNDCGVSGSDCIDNYLWQLGDLGNEQIKQGLLGGESLLLLELAGLQEPYFGNDESVTVKIYGARDADDPYFPANNFEIPAGYNTCCEFKINPQSIVSPPPQARARAPARIERGRLRSLLPVPIQFTLTVGVPPHPEIRLERVLISGRIPASLDSFADGLLGGAVPINTLAQTENPYCKTISPRCPVRLNDSTLIDLVSTLLGPAPDIDLDGDGIECVLDRDGDGAIDLCCNTNDRSGLCDANCSNGRPVQAIDPARPWTCALTPDVADGYSLGITFTARQAKIVGIGQ